MIHHGPGSLKDLELHMEKEKMCVLYRTEIKAYEKELQGYILA